MTTAPTGRTPLNLSDRECDDLTAIDGIGPRWQPKLRKSGISTLQDLAEISEDKIEAVAAEIKGVSDNRIKGWRTKAQEMLSSHQAIGPSELEGEDAANSSATEGEWETFAVFIVEFQAREIEGRAEEEQITVSHMLVKDKTWLENERTEPVVTEGEQLYKRMQDQLGERMPRAPEPSEEKPRVEIQPAAARPVTVEITQVQAFQPPQTETPIGIGKADLPFQGHIKSDEPFALGVSFELGGPAAADIVKKRTAYNAQFHVRNLMTRVETPLGDTKATPLAAGEPSHYTAKLPKASLQPGVYRLQVLVALQSTPPSVGYLEVPMLQVV